MGAVFIIASSGSVYSQNSHRKTHTSVGPVHGTGGYHNGRHNGNGERHNYDNGRRRENDGDHDRDDYRHRRRDHDGDEGNHHRRRHGRD